jgi:hypothetical protein
MHCGGEARLVDPKIKMEMIWHQTERITGIAKLGQHLVQFGQKGQPIAVGKENRFLAIATAIDMI